MSGNLKKKWIKCKESVDAFRVIDVILNFTMQ